MHGGSSHQELDDIHLLNLAQEAFGGSQNFGHWLRLKREVEDHYFSTKSNDNWIADIP